MKIEKVVFYNYKSIAKDCTLNVDSKITTLVGPSESGKTNILEALNKFFIPEAYKDTDMCTFSDSQIDENYKMASVTFRLEDTDLENVSQIDKRICEAQRFTISKQKNGSYVLEEPGVRLEEPQPPQRLVELHVSMRQKLEQIDAILTQFLGSLAQVTPEQQAARQGLDALIKHMPLSGLPPTPTQSEEKEYLQSAINLVADFSARLGAAPNVPAELQQITTELNSELKEAASLPYEVPSDEEPVPKRLLAICPNVISKRDAEIKLLEDSIPISELEAGAKQSIYPVLLKLARLSVADLKQTEASKLGRSLTRGEKKITGLLQIWSQESLKASFMVQQRNFIFNLEGSEGHYGKPSDRSEGFRWFLSFYLSYASSAGLLHNSILLLDEPGLHLHASAQKDLLDQFEQVTQSNQIIYTTHSPFMINKNYPDRIRGVLKLERPQGTSIDNKPYRASKGGSYEPIRTAIGITLGNSLFIGGRNLIVEGISDQIILAALSRYLAREDQPPFINLQEICITPAGGATNVPYFAYLCNMEDMKSVVLLDSDNEGNNAFEKIKREKVFNHNNVLRIQDAVSESEGKFLELEDLINREFYHSAVLEAYKDLPNIAFANELPKTHAEMLKQLSSQGQPPSEQEPSTEHGHTNMGERDPVTKSRGKKPIVNQQLEASGTSSQYFKLFKQHEEKGWGHFDKVLVARRIAQKLDEDELPKVNKETVPRFNRLFGMINKKLGLK